MNGLKDYYILGVPIETKIGKLHPVYMRDYFKFMQFIGTLVYEKDDLIRALKEMISMNNEMQPLLDLANEISLFEFINAFKGDEFKNSILYDMYKQYKRLFEFCFKEDVFDKVETDDDFENLILLMKEINDVKYEKPNPNPEIARFDRLKAKIKERKGETITFEAMYTSVLLSSGVHPNDMTIYQFNKAFDRIGHFKNYDTSILFSTVSKEAKIQPWYGVTRSEKPPTTISEDQLNRARKLRDKGGLQENL